MKFSKPVGVLACLAIIATCFVPWVYILSVNTTVTGVSAENTSFGRPGLINIFFSSLAIIFFVIDRIWAKRTNIFLTTLNFAWALRNFFVVTQCELGECPEKKAGIFILVFLALVILIMSLLPKIELKDNH